MTVFRYDRSFEGLLTTVFDGYARRTFPDALIAEGEPEPMFATEVHAVVTDADKAARVWASLRRRLSGDVCNMLTMGWLSEEPGVDMMLARYMRRVFDAPKKGRDGSSGGVETDLGDPDILRVKQLAQKVSREREHIVQFTRFQKGRAERPATEGDPTGAEWFAPVSPRYNVLPLAVGYFADRFRDQRWLLYDIRRHYGYYYDLKEVTEVVMEDDTHLTGGALDGDMLADDERMFQDMWRDYIDSMAIRERINPRLRRQHMPKRFWPLLTEMQKKSD
jgi:probable DNA metabolism protein